MISEKKQFELISILIPVDMTFYSKWNVKLQTIVTNFARELISNDMSIGADSSCSLNKKKN